MKRFVFFSISLAFLASCGSNKKADSLLLITKEKGIEQLYKLDVNGNISPINEVFSKVAKPNLSPDGSKLAFMSEDMGNWDIHVYDIESGKSVNITNSPAIEGFPSWSPDGKQIAFMSSASGNRDIYVCNIDGSGMERITDAETIEAEPLWNPSGKPVIYFKSANAKYESLHRKDLTSGEVYEIGVPGGANQMLRPVPGKNQISYIQNSTEANTFMLFDEDELQNYSLLETPSRMTSYAWAPSGEQVAITINGQLEVYNYTAEAGLSDSFIVEHAAYPAWSKSGGDLFYNKRVDGILQIFKLNLETNTEKQITHTEFDSTDAMPY